MKPFIPLPLIHSWPLFEQGRHFDLGCVAGGTGIAPFDNDIDSPMLARLGVGAWECELPGDRLIWSSVVYDLFGLPHDARLSRREIVGLYCEPSRAAMEALRTYALKHHRGFTLDAEIQPVTGERRWMRLVTAPICEGGKVVRLRGLKRDVTHEYR